MTTSESRPGRYKRSRERYSRLICLGCRERRIRCELPADVETPRPGELLTVHTPCYRCKKLGVPCVVRQTVLGRPSAERGPRSVVKDAAAATGNIVSPAVKNLPDASRCTQRDSAPVMVPSQSKSLQLVPSSSRHVRRCDDDSCRSTSPLLIHKPQSPETVTIIRAMETLRIERVEDEWFRHLPSHFGHTKALDLSIRAMVSASAYKRGLPKLTAGDCYQSLALALDAVQTAIKQSDGRPDDDVLASTALLAHFEGSTKKHGIPSRLHLHGMAAILVARPSRSPPTQLARDILDFHACESFIQACVQGIPSPYEGVCPSYFAKEDAEEASRERLKFFSNALFVRIPRLVSMAHLLRCQSYAQSGLLQGAVSLTKTLLQLRDDHAEESLMHIVEVSRSDQDSAVRPFRQSLRFPSIDVYEALVYYWQSRLALLRLLWHLQAFVVSPGCCFNAPRISLGPDVGSMVDETSRLVRSILMCAEYAQSFVLNKHWGRFAQAMVSVWGVLKDMPVIASRLQGLDQTDILRRLVLRMVNRALRTHRELTAEDMDVASDIFVGGPLEGRFADIYDV